MTDNIRCDSAIYSFIDDVDMALQCIDNDCCFNFNTVVEHPCGTEVGITFTSGEEIHHIDNFNKYEGRNENLVTEAAMYDLHMYPEVESRNNPGDIDRTEFTCRHYIVQVNVNHRVNRVNICINWSSDLLADQSDELVKFVTKYKELFYSFNLQNVTEVYPIAKLDVSYNKIAFSDVYGAENISPESVSATKEITINSCQIDKFVARQSLSKFKSLRFVRIVSSCVNAKSRDVVSFMLDLRKKGISSEFFTPEQNIRLVINNGLVTVYCCTRAKIYSDFYNLFVKHLLDEVDFVHHASEIVCGEKIPTIPWKFDLSKLRSVTVKASESDTVCEFKLEIKESSRAKSARFIQ